MSGLIHALCPDDHISKDLTYHRKIRLVAACSLSIEEDAIPPDKETVGLIIRNVPNTTPGIDGITSKIVKQAWKLTGGIDEIWRMYRA